MLACLASCSPTFSEEIILTDENAVLYVSGVDSIQNSDILNQLSEKPQAKYLVMFSGGGEILNLDVFAKKVSEYKDLKIVIVKAASAAATITQLVKNERMIVSGGKLMFHRIRCAYPKYLEITQWVKKVNAWVKEDEQFAEWSTSRMKISRKEYDRKTFGRDWELTAKEAIELGAAERIVKAKCSPSILSSDQEIDLLVRPINMARVHELCKFLENSN